MKKIILISAGLAILMLGLTIVLSLRAAEKSSDTHELPLPELEELIPVGKRRDRDRYVRVLDGETEVTQRLEKFLIGVVAAEMPASFEVEALKAQAVAARTDVFYNIYIAKKPRHPDADICTDHTCCMAYTDDETLRENWGRDYTQNIQKIIEAVISTDGVYIEFQDQPILAVFHSSSAGQTENSGNVWSEDLPYLTGVPTPESSETVPNYVSSVTVSHSDFIATVSEKYPEADLGTDKTKWITDITHTQNGRIASLEVGGVLISGPALRSLFALRSTAVTIELTVTDVIFTATGYGHGVGMSQYGANTMAQLGKNYRQILAAYYTGVTITEEIQTNPI